MRDSLDSKGLTATVFAENGDIWSGVYGISHEGVPLTTSMYLGMGSITKSLTAASVLLCEEEGLLSIDDPIQNYLPTYPYVDGNVTIKQLLNHTSGIFNFTDHSNFIDSMQSDFSRVWTHEEVLSYFLTDPYFAAGEGWYYSNTNYVLAGMIIEQVTGDSYEHFVRTKILIPNGLEELFIQPEETTTGDIAHVWLNIPLIGKIDLDAADNTPISVYSSAWSAGSYFARPALIAKWMQLVLSGDILSPESTAKMQTFVPAGSMDYGLGLMRYEVEGHLFIGHQAIFCIAHCAFMTRLVS